MEAVNSHFFSRSWAQLTRDKGWIKPVLVLAVSLFVPIIGVLVLLGYGAQWARLSAWGYDGAPKQRHVNIKECIASGWRAFVVLLGWTVIYSIACAVCRNFFYYLFYDVQIIVQIIDVCLYVLAIFISLVARVAALRAVIYEKISAGYMPVRVFEMVKEAPKELVKVMLIPAAFTLLLALIYLVFSIVVSSAVITVLYEVAYVFLNSGASSLSSDYIEVILEMIRVAFPVLAVFFYITFVVETLNSLMTFNAVGLWMRRFNIAAWGEPTDALHCGPLMLPAPKDEENFEE